MNQQYPKELFSYLKKNYKDFSLISIPKSHFEWEDGIAWLTFLHHVLIYDEERKKSGKLKSGLMSRVCLPGCK